MIDVRTFESLGGANHGWLDAKHHFSFADYHDPSRVHWGALRVWNDDTIAAGTGFPPHPHADMEIITYVREGAITHQDSLGNKGRTEAGDVQVMSAGTGIRHSEYNLESEATRIFQIWIIPNKRGEGPAWGAKPFPQGRPARASSWPWPAASRATPTPCDPHRRPRPGRHHQGRRDDRVSAGPGAQGLSGAFDGQGRAQRRGPSTPVTARPFKTRRS